MKTVFQILAAVATVAVLTAPAQAQMKQSLAHMKHVIASWNDTPDQAGLLPTALEELEIAQQHAALALAKPDDLASLKLHAGHVIHALDPSVEAKGPGRGYGVVKAASGAAKHIGFAAAAADAPPPDVSGLDRALSALRDAFEREGDDLTARALFDRFDGDGDGLLDADEFRVLCQTLVPSFSPAETRFALAHVFERIEADPDEDIMGELAIVHLMKTSPPAHGTIPFVAFEEAIKSLGHRDEE